MIHMNVFDWDNTIYRGDSTVDFVKYLYTKKPKTLLNLPRGIGYGVMILGHFKDTQTCKENFFHMFQYVDNMEEMVDAFTSEHLDHVKDFYKEIQKEDDLVISASPEFLISAFCKKVGIKNWIASPVDIHTGKFEGKNCNRYEKVKRFEEIYGDAKIDAFYSDSLSDAPLANMAKEAYLVKGDVIKDWPKDCQ